MGYSFGNLLLIIIYLYSMKLFNFRKPKEIKRIGKEWDELGGFNKCFNDLKNPCSYLHPVTPEAKAELRKGCPICRKAK